MLKLAKKNHEQKMIIKKNKKIIRVKFVWISSEFFEKLLSVLLKICCTCTWYMYVTVVLTVPKGTKVQMLEFLSKVWF